MQRFYGGDPAGWLDMPMGMLEAYSRMLPRIEAQESLRAIDNTAAGMGTMKKEDQRAYRRALARIAQPSMGEERESRGKKIGKQELAARYAAIGIGVSWQRSGSEARSSN